MNSKSVQGCAGVTRSLAYMYLAWEIDQEPLHAPAHILAREQCQQTKPEGSNTMTDNPITDIDGRTVLVGVRRLYLGDENPGIGIGIYDDDDRQPTPILELDREMAIQLARDLVTVITDPDAVGFDALPGDTAP
jgi:hypothetical protein